MPDMAAASIEFQMATSARRFAPNADPPLNPSHPNQSTNVPSPTSETLCGRKLRSSRSERRPSAHEYARPEIPLAISTGPPPGARRLGGCCGVIMVMVVDAGVVGKRWRTVSAQRSTGEDGRTLTGVVEHAPLEPPPVYVPRPARDRTINDCHPYEREDHRGKHPSAFGERTHEDRDCNACELHLVEAVEQLRDQR